MVFASKTVAKKYQNFGWFVIEGAALVNSAGEFGANKKFVF